MKPMLRLLFATGLLAFVLLGPAPEPAQATPSCPAVQCTTVTAYCQINNCVTIVYQGSTPCTTGNYAVLGCSQCAAATGPTPCTLP